MGVRKSKKIGSVINGYLVLDSRHHGTSTEYLVECQKCNDRYWKSGCFVRNGGKCPTCDGGKVYRNSDGYRHEELYRHYKMIIDRLRSHERYKDVKMCDEWFYDYTSFRAWALSHGYKSGLTLDRIDNERGYEPDNCRWATIFEQANNRRSNIIVTYRGDTDTVANLARKYHKKRSLIYQRLHSGWSVDDAFDKPIDTNKWSNARKETNTCQS